MIHWLPPLLPGLSACPPAVSSKIIPRISREAGPPATVRSQRTFVLAHQTGLPSAGHHHALVLDSYDRFVRLFTPVSAEEADRLERGVPLDGPLYWTDRPVPEETDADAIWIVLTIPYEDLAGANEQSVHPGLGYREFELPPGLPAMFPVERLGLADCLGGRERPRPGLPVPRSAGMWRSPRVTASTPGRLPHRARSGHGVGGVYLAVRLDQDALQRCCAAWRLMPSRAPISAQE